jgi:hypothetical protein
MNKEQRDISNKNWYLLNKDSWNEKRRQQRQELRLMLSNVLGSYACERCGFHEPAICLQFDHKHGGGERDRKLKRLKDVEFLRYYVKHPAEAKRDLQVLCANCNAIKRHEQYKAPIGGLAI